MEEGLENTMEMLKTLEETNVDRVRLCQIQKYEEYVKVLCSEPDGLDVRHRGLNVLDVYDNPHLISFFMFRTDLW